MEIKDYIKTIMDQTDFSEDEVQELVIRKKEELNGLITEEKALFVIAKELNLDRTGWPDQINLEKLRQERIEGEKGFLNKDIKSKPIRTVISKNFKKLDKWNH